MVSEGAPSACPGLFPRGLARRGAGCRLDGGLVSAGAGSALYVSRSVARGARPWAGGRGRKGVRGKPGETPGFGGVPRVPPRRLQASTPGRRGAVYARAARSAGSRTHFPGNPARPVPGSMLLSTVIGAAGSVVAFWGGRNGGLGENLEPGRGFAGPGGFRVFPSAFPDWSPLLSVYSCSRAVVFLTSPSCLVEGVRSGTRRRRGASASAQAGGGTGPGTRRTAPARAGAALYGR